MENKNKVKYNKKKTGRCAQFLQSSQQSFAVDRMTSRDFQLDTKAHIEVAAQQLKDKVCINNFQAAILHNKHLFRGRVVLDISCGLGLLSLFAAKAGAAQVYAVDNSNVTDYAKRIVKANGYADIIHVLKGRIQDVELPVKEVDIIVCNWMGYSLLFQATCDSVILARDKWLKKDTGLIFPDTAKLFMAAVEDDKHKSDRVDWWNDVYGFNMNCLREFALSEPCFQAVTPHQVLSTQSVIKCINLYTASIDDLKFRCKYMLEMRYSGRMDGIVTYFQVYFSKSHTSLNFSTDPWSPYTHWVQSVFFFDHAVSVNAGELFYGGIEMFSVGGKCNLNNMEVRLEMYSGDPEQMLLETDMRWELKPHAVADENTAAEAEELQKKQLVAVSQKIQDINNNGNKNKTDLTATAITNTNVAIATVKIGKHGYANVAAKTHRKSKQNKKSVVQ